MEFWNLVEIILLLALSAWLYVLDAVAVLQWSSFSCSLAFAFYVVYYTAFAVLAGTLLYV